MDFNFLFSTKKQEIDSEIDSILNLLNKDASEMHPTLPVLIELFKDSCMGGKRIRGIFVLLGIMLAKGELNNDAVKIAAGFEIFHTAILIHDDIMDKSLTRRGKTTIHHKLGGHYGIAQTISLGDIGMFLAVKILSESGFPTERKNKAISLFTRYTIDTALGQMMDIALPRESIQTEEDIMTLMRSKTARYSIISPLQIGAILAGADEDLLKHIEKFGEELGIAYQIHDDMLGIFGSDEVIGKSTLSDIEEGKMTLLYSKAREEANNEQLHILKTYYGVKSDTTGLENIRTIFKETGAYDYAKETFEMHLSRARGHVMSLSDNNNLHQLLYEVIDYLAERQS